MAQQTNIQCSYLTGGTWRTFSNQISSAMDGIKIQTPTNSPYYLQYRTWNAGRTAWYPYVQSNIDDYAGSSGKPIQQLQIQAYKNDGTKITTGLVVMYRALVEGKWLAWVSNADPAWMENVQAKYNLGGTIDTSGYYAGIAGKNISGIEIRVYDEEPGGNFSGGETTSMLSYMVDNTWTNFTNSTVAPRIDGIKIQTGTSKDYYLLYKTWNAGQSGYYPAVKSNVNDYAGSSGKAIQRLSIQAYKNDGTKLTSGVIVMYRAYVEGKWLPWASNADPEWMRNVQNKYSLDGTLDFSASYAGSDGKNISGIEIRIFEDDSLNAGSDDFTGDEIPLTLGYMANSESNWISFSKSVTASPIDGIRIQTPAASDFYLRYMTWNAGRDSYYPEVTSTGTDYAGSAGKPIQRLSIHVYKNDGTKLTSGVVVMYRAKVGERWLPWVSNADPEWMRSVQRQYNLGGTLDTGSSYAGISGQNISGIEIRAFKGNTNDTPIENLPGSETTATLSYMLDSNTNWHSFTNSVMASHIDGIKIQTSAGKGYYLSYKTLNAGNSNYYSEVTSTQNDYAGWPGKPIQCLSIRAYRNDGVKLTTGVVVMYRAYTDGRWLPWVSNAAPEWMRSVQVKYNLGGSLDTSGYYAGIVGKNIGGIEIRIFEENNADMPPQMPVGKYKIINVPFITQVDNYPTGCESVSTVMALRHIGNYISVDKFIDSYLNKTGVPFDPNISFGGNPKTTYGYGCYAPVIQKALDKVLDGTGYYAETLKDVSLASLCSQYIDNNIPVIMWATMYMNPPYISSTWMFNGQKIKWVAPEHCLLLVGYDENNYIFNDPLQNQALTFYSKSSVETAYQGLYKQAVVIKKGSVPPGPVENYVQPDIPVVSAGTPSITSFVSAIRDLETAYKKYFDDNFIMGMLPLTPIGLVIGVTNLLRSEGYNDWEWTITTSHAIDEAFVSRIKKDYSTLYNKFWPYIRNSEPSNNIEKALISDGDRGLIDLAHFAATIETYLTEAELTFTIPRFWGSWGGDLATGAGDTAVNISNRDEGKPPYIGKSDKEIADASIGKQNLRCNYVDFCCDFDAYKISQKIKERYEQENSNFHLLSESIDWYYTHYTALYNSRFKWILEELDCSSSLNSLKKAIKEKMNEKGKWTLISFGTVVDRKGGTATKEIADLCCDSFANYIYTMWTK